MNAAGGPPSRRQGDTIDERPGPQVSPARPGASGATGVSAMTDLIRFGRRVPLPSSVQILHDLLVMGRNDNAVKPDIAPPIKAKADPEAEISASTPSHPPETI